MNHSFLIFQFATNYASETTRMNPEHNLDTVHGTIAIYLNTALTARKADDEAKTLAAAKIDIVDKGPPSTMQELEVSTFKFFDQHERLRGTNLNHVSSIHKSVSELKYACDKSRPVIWDRADGELMIVDGNHRIKELQDRQKFLLSKDPEAPNAKSLKIPVRVLDRSCTYATIQAIAYQMNEMNEASAKMHFTTFIDESIEVMKDISYNPKKVTKDKLGKTISKQFNKKFQKHAPKSTQRTLYIDIARYIQQHDRNFLVWNLLKHFASKELSLSMLSNAVKVKFKDSEIAIAWFTSNFLFPGLKKRSVATLKEHLQATSKSIVLTNFLTYLDSEPKDVNLFQPQGKHYFLFKTI